VRRVIGWSLATVLAACLYLMFWPVPIRPVVWQAPPNAGYTGPHAVNARLSGVQRVDLGREVGPEHIEPGPDGRLYTGVLSGAILAMQPDGSDLKTFAQTGGRPLGLAFNSAGQLIVADALRGLLVIDGNGASQVLADQVDGTPIRYADAVVAARDGRLIFTDASQRFPPQGVGTFDAALFDILEHSCTGRVLEYDPMRRAARVIIGGLCFPNGVVLSADESDVLIAETGEYRIWRVSRAATRLDAGQAASGGNASARVLLANLPGFPDNLSRGADGRIWTGFTKPRSAAIDSMAGKRWLRAVTMRLPRALWPVPPPYGHVMAFDETGRVLADLQDPKGAIAETSGATEHAGRLYVQSLHANALGIVSRSAAGL
jgi:sugar lactone lactonase YvrE